ncbi:MAG TPA: DUF2064 domain-containing protein [Pseudonocardiaceae bacterium]|nr:DUF2064 domain-containing protein [Pseudonocardiaceae bacterium]
MNRFCLLVVAKAPVAGLAKTRLTPPATPRAAAEIAAAALLDTLLAVRDTPGAIPLVAMTGDLSAAQRSGELQDALAAMTVIPQRGNSFADRLANAHADAATRFPGRPVVQIGMDTPQVTPDLLAGVAPFLSGAPAVLGEAEDGGWWVLGLRDPSHAEALREVPMSRADTAAWTLKVLERRGLRVTDGPRLTDVDTMADAVTVARDVPGSRFAAAVAATAAGFRG